MPVNADDLLKDLQKWVTRFEGDLRERCKEMPELEARLKGQYDTAREAKRTAHPYGTWRDDALTQSAVAWVLSCTFVRFLEDNDLLETPFLSGPGELRDIAGEARASYFNENPAHSDDDYLRHSETDDQETIHTSPLLAYLAPGRFATIDRSSAFPFPKSMKK